MLIIIARIRKSSGFNFCANHIYNQKIPETLRNRIMKATFFPVVSWDTWSKFNEACC